MGNAKKTKKFKKGIAKSEKIWYDNKVARACDNSGSGARGYGSVVQLVRTLACHARGRGFEPHPNRQEKQFRARRSREDVRGICLCSSVGRAED